MDQGAVHQAPGLQGGEEVQGVQDAVCQAPGPHNGGDGDAVRQALGPQGVEDGGEVQGVQGAVRQAPGPHNGGDQDAVRQALGPQRVEGEDGVQGVMVPNMEENKEESSKPLVLRVPTVGRGSGTRMTRRKDKLRSIGRDAKLRRGPRRLG